MTRCANVEETGTGGIWRSFGVFGERSADDATLFLVIISETYSVVSHVEKARKHEKSLDRFVLSFNAGNRHKIWVMLIISSHI